MGEPIKIATTSEIAPGSGKVVSVNTKKVALFNLNGQYYAIDNTCLHKGGPLGEGECDGETVTCPWHGWQYNVTTGQNLMNPAVAVKTYEVRVEGTDVKIVMP